MNFTQKHSILHYLYTARRHQADALLALTLSTGELATHAKTRLTKDAIEEATACLRHATIALEAISCDPNPPTHTTNNAHHPTDNPPTPSMPYQTPHQTGLDQGPYRSIPAQRVPRKPPRPRRTKTTGGT